jgi:hypothetical protein
MPKTFWDFPAYVKFDVLEERKHAHLITGAMCDSETSCAKVDRESFILYGPDEGLLITPKSFYMKVSLELYDRLCSVLRKN